MRWNKWPYNVPLACHHERSEVAAPAIAPNSALKLPPERSGRRRLPKLFAPPDKPGRGCLRWMISMNIMGRLVAAIFVEGPMQLQRRSRAIGFCLVLLGCSHNALGQAGALDSIFGVGGVAINDLGCFGGERAYSMLLQPDGKLLLAGYCYGQSVARFMGDGSLDLSFGVDGIFLTGLGIGSGTYVSAGAIGLQTDGKVLVAGHDYNGADVDFALMRLNTDGTVDSTFGSTGLVTTSIGSMGEQPFAIAVQPDGRILVAGNSRAGSANADFALVRYNSDGTLDNSFDGDGKLTTGITTGNDEAYAMSLQPDGKIVLAGICTSGGNSDVALVRYEPNGAYDTAFDFDGIARFPITANEDDAGVAMALQPDGKVIVTGCTSDSLGFVMATLRLNADGSLDDTFGEDGKVTTNIGPGWEKAFAICLQPDGKVNIGGYAGGNTAWIDAGFTVVRYTASGELDSSFAVNGSAVSLFSTYSEIHALAMQPDLKIIAAGFTVDTTSTTGYDLAFARYISGLNVGVVDFSTNPGIALVYPNPLADEAVLEYELSASGALLCELFNAQGRLERTLFSNAQRSHGKHREKVDLSGLAAGHYTLVLTNGTGKMSVGLVKR